MIHVVAGCVTRLVDLFRIFSALVHNKPDLFRLLVENAKFFDFAPRHHPHKVNSELNLLQE